MLQRFRSRNKSAYQSDSDNVTFGGGAMRFGVNTFLWTATFTERNFDLLPAIRDHGFDGIEVSLFGPQEFQATKIRHALRGYGLGCTVCSVLPNGMSLISDDSDIR